MRSPGYLRRIVLVVTMLFSVTAIVPLIGSDQDAAQASDYARRWTGAGLEQPEAAPTHPAYIQPSPPSDDADPAPTPPSPDMPSSNPRAVPTHAAYIQPSPPPDPTETPTPSPTATTTPESTVTPSPAPDPTATSSPTPPPTVTPTPEPTATPSPTPSPTPTLDPAITLSFTVSSIDDRFCDVFVHMSGFVSNTSYTLEYRGRFPGSSGNGTEYAPVNVTTNSDGAVDQKIPSFGIGAGIRLSTEGVTSGWTRVSCQSAPSPDPSITLTFSPTTTPLYCNVRLHMSGFTPDTVYSLEYLQRDGSEFTPVTVRTNSDGAVDQGIGSFSNGPEIRLSTDSVTSGWTRVSC